MTYRRWLAVLLALLSSCQSTRKSSDEAVVKADVETEAAQAGAWNEVGNIFARSAINYFGGEYCREPNLNPTYECKDFCGAFHPTSMFSKAELGVIYASYITFLPVEWQKNVINGILYVLGQGRVNTATAGAIGCAVNFLAAISLEEMDRRHCAATNSASSCVLCGQADQSLRATCRIIPALVTCALQMNVPVPGPILAISTVGCTGGTTIQKEILRESCLYSCSNSILAATPIATPTVTPSGRVAKRCCQCERKYFEDSYWPQSDNIFQTDYFWNNVSDTDAAVPECEGKENTYKTDISELHNGYSVYHQYTNCKKVYVVGEKCPSDSSFHETIKFKP